MQVSRVFVRWAALSLLASIVVPILVAVCGEFFIKLAEEQGAYNNPTAKLGAAVIVLSWFVTQTWFLVGGGLVAGLTVGLWFDPVLRRWEARYARTQILNPQGEPGFLDWSIEGAAAAARLSKILTMVANDAQRATRRMNRYGSLIALASNHTIKRWFTRRLARHLTKLSGRMHRHSQAIRPETLAFRTTFLPLVQFGAINTASDVHALTAIGAASEPAIENTRGMIEAITGAKVGLSNLRGVTRDLNYALDSVVASFDELVNELRAFLGICEEVRSIAYRRVVEYSWLTELPSPQSPPSIAEKLPQDIL